MLTNTTVVDSSNFGYVTTHNRSVDPRSVSSVNFDRDMTRPNLTATVITDDLDICVTPNRTTSAHLVLDVVGYLDGSTFAPVVGTADRILDTRLASSPTTGQPAAAGATVCAETPPHSAGDVAVANVTVTQPSGGGFTTVHAEGVQDPTATSTHNYLSSETVANLTFTPLGTNRVCATNSRWASAHIIVDFVGFVDAAAFSAESDRAIRLLDTRLPDSPSGGERLEPSETVCVDVPAASSDGVAIANVTITESTGNGFATVHHESADPTSSSTHNFTDGQTVPNLTATMMTDAGQVCVTPSRWSSVHAIIDLAGVVSPDAFTGFETGARRVIDTRLVTAIPGRHGIARLTEGASCDALLAKFRDERLAQLDQLPVFDDPDNPPIALPATNGNEPISVPEFSTTNTQNEGVDEGDTVETDGRYLYTTVENELRIIEIASADVVARVRLDGPHAEMILHRNRLMVTTRGFDDGSWDFTHTNVVVIDVSDPTNPSVVDRYGLDGTRVAMRSVEGRVHIVLESYRSADGHLNYWVDEATLAELRDAVAASTIDDWLPQVYDIGPGGTYTTSRTAVDCSSVAIPHVGSGAQLTWVASDDLNSGSGPSSSTGVMATAHETNVMASSTNLYIATTSYPQWVAAGWRQDEIMTSVHQFEMTGNAGVRYAASGDVPGRLINQFAMGEQAGVLRVAVTEGWWGDDTSSAVFALRRVGSTFERLSAITDLGVGEQIYAVRHLGAQSYVVTFRQVDPLYVLDFSDPIHPVLQGELKIPGFSTYLHPVGPGLLLGVGMDAEDDGRVEGAQLSLFDVSDPAHPTRISALALDSDAQFSDHRAFLFWPPNGTIAIPSIRYGTNSSSISVARLDGRTLRSVGELAPGTGWRCQPTRTIAVGDELIAVSDYTVVIADAASLTTRAVVGECLPGWVIERQP